MLMIIVVMFDYLYTNSHIPSECSAAGQTWSMYPMYPIFTSEEGIHECLLGSEPAADLLLHN